MFRSNLEGKVVGIGDIDHDPGTVAFGVLRPDADGIIVRMDQAGDYGGRPVDVPDLAVPLDGIISLRGPSLHIVAGDVGAVGIVGGRPTDRDALVVARDGDGDRFGWRQRGLVHVVDVDGDRGVVGAAIAVGSCDRNRVG